MRRLAWRLLMVTGIAAVLTPLTVLHVQVVTGTNGVFSFGSAPYLLPFDADPPDPVAVMKATGQRTFELAVIHAARAGGCVPSWNGTRDVAADTYATSLIDRIRTNGGDVGVAVGGDRGPQLGQVCASPQATAAAYQSVISKYRLRAIDFDLEEPGYDDAQAIDNELGAAQILQRTNAHLFVSVTTTGTPDGVGPFGRRLLQQAKRLAFLPDDFSVIPPGGSTVAAAQIRALDGFHAILMDTVGLGPATAFAHEGVSLANGRYGGGEMLGTSAFQDVLAYASAHHLSRFTFWSVNRDRPCTQTNRTTAPATCSAAAHTAFQFTAFAARFAAPDRQPLNRGTARTS